MIDGNRSRVPVRNLTHPARGPIAMACALLAAAVLAIAPGASAYQVRGAVAPEMELRSPRPGALEEEGSILLSWSADRRASDYTVFVDTRGLEGRTAEELIADPLVAKKSLSGTSVRLQDVLRGAEGQTAYQWAVASRDRDSGALTLSAPSSFTATKTFAGDAPNNPLIREVTRGAFTPEPYADGASLLFASGLRFDPIREGEPQIPASLTATMVREDETGSFLVQFDRPVTSTDREALAGAGAVLFSYVPNYAFVVRMPGSAIEAVRALAGVRWVGAYHPAYRISAQREMNETAGTRILSVLLFPDADLAAAQTGLEAMGGSILEATDSGRNKLMRVSIDMARLSDIAARNDVAWVEPWHQNMLDNSSAQWVVQTGVSLNRRVWDMGINGTGQVVHTSDSGITSAHNQFVDPGVPITNFGDFPTHRKIIAYHRAAAATTGITFGDAAGASYHGTHTAGSICGNDSTFAADARDGNSKGAKIFFHDGGAAANTITAPVDMNLMFNDAYAGNAGGAPRISSNSWGSNSAGAYDLQCMTLDQFMWDHKDFLTFFSSGNAGTPGSVGSPSSNKSGVSAGGTQNGASQASIYSGTSRGPTADGRRKPTICAPAQNISSANGGGTTGYASLTGTSMSSPTMAGATSLIRQYLTEGWYPTGAKVPANGFNPSAALLKSMGIASTDNDMTGFTVPDNNVGWGRIKVDNILYFAGDAKRLALVDDRDGLATGEFVDYEVNVTASTEPLKISLVWTDKEGNPSASRQLVNDLDLTVTDPSLVVYKGNVFSAGQSTTGGSRDSLNVEEGVRRTTPGTGIWKIRVAATNAPFSPQAFAVVVSGVIGGDNGLVRLDKGNYGESDVIEIRVEDLNASSPITVNVASTTEAAGENLSIAGANGVFVGTIATTAVASPGCNPGSGTLCVTHGDVITATYSDASPVAAVQATAGVDFTGPVITNVQGGNGQNESVKVTWTTDVLATSRVYYGLSPALGQSTALDSTLTTSHSVTVSSVLPDTTYYFDVESKTHSGNTTRDDAGGNHYRFTTGKRGDVLLVIGDPTFDKTALYVTALDALGWDYNILQGGTIVDPLVGDKSAGLRSYKAIWWQVGLEQYPPFENSTRDSITKYEAGGGRISFVTHDAAWTFTDVASGYQSMPRLTWLHDALHVNYLADPTTWASNTGIALDPISGAYTGGTPYAPHRAGAAGDEISVFPGTGSGTFVWRNTDVTPNNIAMKWVDGVPSGSPDSAVWGGTPTQVLTNCVEWAHFTDAAARQDILDKSIIWLIGRDHPDAAVSTPAPASTVTTNSTPITWTETTFGGTSVAARRIDYSLDGGSSWTLVTTSPGASPYSWDVSALPNGDEYLVRVVITDDGSPSMTGGLNPSPAGKFSIDRTGGDTRGPVVVAGTIESNPNPLDNTVGGTLSATVTDVGYGGAVVTQAEWSVGSPAPAGTGNAMTGAFAASTEAVSAAIAPFAIAPGTQPFFVRARDAAGNWGPATSLVIVVNGVATGVEGSALPARFALDQNWPNPFNPSTLIRYSIAKESAVSLQIYNTSGQVVRTLVDGRQTPGFKQAAWDGTNDAGKPVSSGVYMYTLRADTFEDSNKMVLVK